jgi:hypothetical protein
MANGGGNANAPMPQTVVSLSTLPLQFEDPEGHPATYFELWYSADGGGEWEKVGGPIYSRNYSWTAPDEVATGALLELVACDAEGPMGSYLSNAFDVLNGVTAVDEPKPDRFALRFAGRTPAPQATLQFGMPVAGEVTVRVYDVRGALVQELANGMFEPGWHHVKWEGAAANGAPAQPGVYFVQANANGEKLLKRFVLLK